MKSFALYRKPFSREVSMIGQSSSSDCCLSSLHDLGKDAGFVVVPFRGCNSAPIVLIRADVEMKFADAHSILSDKIKSELNACGNRNLGELPQKEPLRTDYSHDFSLFHARLCQGEYDKLVLARRNVLRCDALRNPVELFAEACDRYPRMFIALVSAPACGTWLVSTPELLLESNGGHCRTMALAGTMEYEGVDSPLWSEKNIREQSVVARYIYDVVSRFSEEKPKEEGPKTVRAGSLVHLRSDFEFSLLPGASLGKLVEDLTPTPAVCGIPKDKAKEFIISNESLDRSYYSGFIGPVDARSNASLYVSLRCMQLCAGGAILYAGGGLLSDSEEESEWKETESKMDTMRALCICDLNRVERHVQQ